MMRYKFYLAINVNKNYIIEVKIMKKKVSKIIPKDDVLENLFNLRKIIIETKS